MRDHFFQRQACRFTPGILRRPPGFQKWILIYPLPKQVVGLSQCRAEVRKCAVNNRVRRNELQQGGIEAKLWAGDAIAQEVVHVRQSSKKRKVRAEVLAPRNLVFNGDGCQAWSRGDLL